MSTTNEWVSGLRDLADFLEQNEEFVPTYAGVQLDVFAFDADDLKTKSHALGGDRVKQYKGEYACVSRFFGPHHIDVNVSRSQVCERVVTGERTITQEIVEWRCDGAFEVNA